MSLQGTDLLALYRSSDSTNRKLSIDNLADYFNINPPSIDPPDSPVNGEIWVDISDCPPVLYIWSDCTGTGEWHEIGSGGGLEIITPDPDNITSNPPLTGSGTELDPYILTSITVRPAGASGQTVEYITINVPGAEPGQVVSWTDNSTGAETRFTQPVGVTGADGTWSGRLVYNDTPDTTVDQDYTGDLQIGNVYFRWIVSQGVEAVRPIEPTPDEITSEPDFQGGSGTENDPFILETITVAPAGGAGQSKELITIAEVGATQGETVRWIDNSTGAGDRFAQPEGTTGADGSWSGRLIYTDNPDSIADTTYTGNLQIGEVYFRWNVIQEIVLVVAEIEEPVILAPPNGAGVGGDVTYTPKTSEIVAPIEDIDGTWHAVSGPQKSWISVAYGNNVYVAVARSTQSVMTSPDGETWTERPNAAFSNASWEGITFGGGKFVAVGAGIQTYRGAMYSSDGINWTETTVPGLTTSFRNVVYGAPSTGPFAGQDLFVAVGDSGDHHVMYSTDGVTWVGGTGVVSAKWLNIAYGNGMFVATSSIAYSSTNKEQLMYSTDAINWTTVKAPIPDTAGLYGITYGDGKFVAVAGPASVAETKTNLAIYSTDGIDWKSSSDVPSRSWSAVTYGAGRFVAIASYPFTNLVMYSTDAINWTGGKGPDDGNTGFWEDIVYGGGKFVCVSTHSAGDSSTFPAGWSYTGTGANVKGLTFEDANTYNADTNADMGQPISETFTAGQTVTGVKTGSPSAVGTLTADAVGNTMTVEPITELAFKSASAAENNSWEEVTYGDGMFVAIATTGINRVMYSTDGINWTEALAAQDNSWQSITYGDGKFVAVAKDGTRRVMYSTDGINWSRVVAPGDSVWSSVTYGDGTFVAVASDGADRVMYSTDGALTWTAASATEASTWTSVTYGDGKFVAVSYSGSSNRVMYSTNGSNWTAALAAASIEWGAVTYGDGMFVAVAFGGNNRVMYSANGINWTLGPEVELNNWYSVTYGGGKFVAVSYNGTNQVMYSTDGINWTRALSAEQNLWFGLTYGDGKFVATSRNGTNQVMYAYDFGAEFVPGMEVINTTDVTKEGPGAEVLEFVGSTPVDIPDGSIDAWGDATWEVSTDSAFTAGNVMTATKVITPDVNQTLEPDERGAIVLDGDTEYWARLSYNATNPALGNVTSDPPVHFKTAFSEDGWFSAKAAEDNWWWTVTYGDGKFVSVSANGTNRVMYSTDAINWTSVLGEDSGDWLSVTYGNGTFVAVASNGTGNRVMYSTDAINWTSTPATDNNYWSAVTYGDDKFVAVGSDRVMYSTNGINWTAATSPEANDWNSVTYGDGTFVAVALRGTANRAMYSTNGINWTAATPPENNGWRSVTYGDGKFVSISSNGDNRVMYSTDGSNWTGATAAEDNSWEAVTYGDGMFVAVATAGTNQVMYSTDGINWAPSAAAEDDGWRAVTYGDGKFVATTSKGTNRVMWSITGVSKPNTRILYDESDNQSLGDQQLVRRFGINPDTADLTQFNIAELTEQPDYPVAAYVPQGDKYKPIEDQTAKVQALEDEVEAAQATVEDLETRLLARITALEAAQTTDP